MVLLAVLVDLFLLSIGLSTAVREQNPSQMKRQLLSLHMFPCGKRAWVLPCTLSASGVF